MKKIWKYFVTVVIVVTLRQIDCKAQITYEHTYQIVQGVQTPILIDLGNKNYKYYILDGINNKIDLYNLDHSLYMNITIPVSLGNYGVAYVTNALFDCDSTNIEYAMLFGAADDTATFRVFREDGTLLFQKDSTTTPYCYGCSAGGLQFNGINNTPDGTKLMLFKSSTLEFFVYDLCGSLPVNLSEPFKESGYVKVFPNPASHNITFEIDPPSNIYPYQLIIYNSLFQTIKTIAVNGYTKINVDTGGLSSDTYFYSLQDNKKVFQSSKFVISK